LSCFSGLAFASTFAARDAAPHHHTGTRVYEINHKHAHKILGTAPPTQVPQTVPETHAANVSIEDNVVGDQYIWILSGADLRQSFGRQLPVDRADDALVQGFVCSSAPPIADGRSTAQSCREARSWNYLQISQFRTTRSAPCSI
jgi:hypothetical protein